MHTKCLNCQKTDILQNLRVAEEGHGGSTRDLRLESYEKPDALIFKGTHRAKLKADVCRNCGHVMFYISNPAASDLDVSVK